MKNIFYICLLATLAACNSNHSGNLIINGSAELPLYDSLPSGWINVSGHWKSVEGDSISHNYAWAQDGKYHFFEGDDLSGILSQSIDVGKYSTSIDKNKQQFIFSGFVQVFPQVPPDQCEIRIACLQKPGGKPLYSFSSDTISSVSKWQPVKDTFIAPASTRFIQIQLIAQRRNGADNDGYFDNLSLITSSGGQFSKQLLIGLIIATICIILYIVNKKRTLKKNKTVTEK